MTDRYMNRVSCKAALYTPDRTKVLIVESLPGKFALPGGHMEEDETPDEAMRRELFEELGLEDVTLQHKDFWMHKSGKLVLGFVGELSEQTKLVIQEEEILRTHWVLLDDIESRAVDVRSYHDFVVASK